MVKKITLGDLADQWDKQLPDLLRVSRIVLGKEGLNEHHSVTATQIRELKERWDTATAASNQPSLVRPSISSGLQLADTLSSPISDRRPTFNTLRFPDLGFKIWCHQDVYEGLQEQKQLSKRATMALRQIVAFGHTSVAKGCSDPANRGWLRSPLGGGSQNHYYLWWTRQGSPPIENLPIGRDDIIVRSVRHHDDHKLLVAGNIDDYLPIEREKLGEVASEFESPWNQEQLSFINSDEPVRLAIGRPGSGKTTVLWQSVDLRTSQDVLDVPPVSVALGFGVRG